MPADTSWSFNPGVLVSVAAIGTVYVRRWRVARASAPPHAPTGGQLTSFLGGLACVLVALVSPLDRLADQLLLAHMVQHILLLDIAPILLILGLSKVLLRPLTRAVTALERRAGPLAHPAFAVVLYTGAMCAWHVPALYDVALRHPVVHVLEHLCFAAAGSLYWWHLLSPIRSRLRLGGMGPIAYMCSSKLALGLLGIALTFDPDVLYSFYAHQPTVWGLSHHSDQAIAGAVMALEQSMVMGVALVLLFTRALSESERAQQRRERLEAAEEIDAMEAA